MINSIFGKIGGGKTLYAVQFEIIPELVEGYRTIVTNVSLDLPALAAYLAKTYPNIDPIDLHTRVRLLSVDEMAEFFSHREHGVDLEIPSNDEWRKGKNVCYDYNPALGPEKDSKGNYLHPLKPVKYVLDEVHVKFDARGWQNQGPHVTFYNSQHRKLDDEIVFISQFPELVDKRLKAFSQEYIYTENNALQTFLSVFRAPSYFTVKAYLRERTGHNDVAQWSKRFTINLAVAACYDTSAGVGIKGQKKPEKRKKRGINLLWAIPVVIVAGIAIDRGTTWAGNKVADVTGAPVSISTQPEKEPVKTQTQQQQQPANQIQPKTILPPIRDDGMQPQTPLTVTGYVRRGAAGIVVFSDGRTAPISSGLFKTVNAHYVILVDGTFLWVKAHRPPLPLVVDPVEKPEGGEASASEADLSSKGGNVLDSQETNPYSSPMSKGFGPSA